MYAPIFNVTFNVNSIAAPGTHSDYTPTYADYRNRVFHLGVHFTSFCNASRSSSAAGNVIAVGPDNLSPQRDRHHAGGNSGSTAKVLFFFPEGLNR